MYTEITSESWKIGKGQPQLAIDSDAMPWSPSLLADEAYLLTRQLFCPLHGFLGLASHRGE